MHAKQQFYLVTYIHLHFYKFLNYNVHKKSTSQTLNPVSNSCVKRVNKVKKDDYYNNPKASFKKLSNYITNCLVNISN